MKNAIRLAALMLLFVALYACSNTSVVTRNLNSVNKLPSQLFKLNAKNDTVITTQQGIAFLIEKGTFDNEVTLEVKEALTINDMVKYGLTTMADGKPLSTDGMFYINGTYTNGQQAKINKPISVSVPANKLLEDPKLFTGELTADSTINWKNPVELTNAKLFKKDTISGEALFKQNCASCHNIKPGHYPGTEPAPPFVGLEKRMSYEYFEFFSKNELPRSAPSEVHFDTVSHTDPCLRAVRNAYNQSVSNPHNNYKLTDEECQVLWKYLVRESKKLDVDLATVEELSYCFEEYDSLPQKKRDTSFDWNANANKTGTIPEPTAFNYIKDPDDFFKNPTEIKYYAYIASITTFNWYNIDMFVEPNTNGIETTIAINVNNYTDYSIVSATLIYKKAQSTVLLKHLENGVFGLDQSVYLPKDDVNVYVLAEKEDKLFYSIVEADVSEIGKNRVKISKTVDLKPTTIDEVETLLDEKYQTKPIKKRRLRYCDCSVAWPAPARPQ